MLTVAETLPETSEFIPLLSEYLDPYNDSFGKISACKFYPPILLASRLLHLIHMFAN